MKISWTLFLLLIAVVMDVTTGKISNRLICLGMSTGLFFQIWESGIRGVFLFILQMILPVVVLFLLFLMRALGAGDIKLFSMIGSIWNLEVIFYCVIFSFIAGAFISFGKLLYHKNLFTRLKYFFGYIQRCAQTRIIGIYREQSEGKQNIIYFSIAIFIGFCFTMGVIY